MSDKNKVLEYKNKVLAQERKRQKISQEAAAIALTLNVDQIKSLENNLNHGFITTHFKNLALKRYAEFLGIKLSSIIIPALDIEEDLELEQHDLISNIKDIKLPFLSNLIAKINNIYIVLILIGVIFFIFNHYNNDEKISSTDITISNSKISKKIITETNISAPVTNEFIETNKTKTTPAKYNTNQAEDLISSESIEFLCTINSAPIIKIWSRTEPEKPATYFHIVSQKKQSICTIDNRGIEKQYDLDAGTKLTHRGEAPFKIQLDPSISDLYFQGWKVILKKTDIFIQLNPVEMTLESN